MCPRGGNVIKLTCHTIFNVNFYVRVLPETFSLQEDIQKPVIISTSEKLQAVASAVREKDAKILDRGLMCNAPSYMLKNISESVL